jgi:hypothetical protein
MFPPGLQVCVDLSFLTTGYVDIATLSDFTHITAGSLYYYCPWHAALDRDQLINDLRWNVARPQARRRMRRAQCMGFAER